MGLLLEHAKTHGVVHEGLVTGRLLDAAKGHLARSSQLAGRFHSLRTASSMSGL